MRDAFVGLGANLGQPAEQLRGAIRAIGGLPHTRVRAVSRFYRSAPMGPPSQPDYCNAVLHVRSALAPRALLEALIAIERAAGRVRGGERWGPRELDLDLLHVVGVQCEESGLHLPHPGLARRNFVLVPLAEIAADLVIEGVGHVAKLAADIGTEGLQPWYGPRVQ